jgi:hypothetical protein
MAGASKASAQELANALLEWRGNVQAAADSLGLSRNSLYERLRRLGLNLEGFRRAGKAVIPVTVVPSVPGMRGRLSSAQSHEHAQQNDSAKFTNAGARPTFGAMEEVSEAPTIQAAPRRRGRAPRLRPPQVDRLQEAKLDFGARHRVETTEDLILQQFFDEAFERWFGLKMEPAHSPLTTKKRGRR